MTKPWPPMDRLFLRAEIALMLFKVTRTDAAMSDMLQASGDLNRYQLAPESERAEILDRCDRALEEIRP